MKTELKFLGVVILILLAQVTLFNLTPRRAMLNLPPSVRVFISAVPADMPRSVDGLANDSEAIVIRVLW